MQRPTLIVESSIQKRKGEGEEEKEEKGEKKIERVAVCGVMGKLHASHFQAIVCSPSARARFTQAAVL